MKKRMLSIVAAVVLATLSACGSNANLNKTETPAEYGVPEEDAELTVHEAAGEDEALAVYEYEADIIRYREPIFGEFTFRKDVKKTETDRAVYYFEASISEQERQACIAAAERAFCCIDGVLPKIEIVVLTPESYEGVSMSEHRLYTSLQSKDFNGFLAECLLTAYGEWGNYGLAYGYANHLCKEAGLDCRETDGFLSMSSTEMYDLNLLCFNESFVSPDDVKAAKNNACLFVDDYLTAHSEAELLELLYDSGTTERVERANVALEAFYAKNGAECRLTEIRYQYGGVAFDYAAACEYAVFYLDKDWQDTNWETNPKVSENFLHEDYLEVKAFFECNVRQMRQYQELFGFDSYDNDLIVFFSNDTSLLDTSFYQMGNDTIYLKSVVSLMHEYIHSLMDGHDDLDNLWTYEGFARNYDCLYNDYAYDYWDYDYNNFTEIHGPHENGAYLDVYIEHIGRPITIKTDYRDLGDFLAYACTWDDPNLNYFSGASFVAYLVDCYGEQAVIRYIGADKQYNAEWGKSYEELVQDWLDYINENYSWYGAG